MQGTIKSLKKCGKGGIITMNGKQYNNVINHTLKRLSESDTLGTARAIFKNMGVALPQGDVKAVYDTLKTDNYMGWKSCSMDEAQTAANEGIAATGISEKRIVVLSADDEEQPIAQTTSVMSLDENTSAYAVAGLEYYSYSYGETGQGGCGGGDSCYHSNSLFNCNNKTSLMNELVATMGSQRPGSNYSTEECIDIVLNYDYYITNYCNLYCVPKEFVQTLLLRELWCLNPLDAVADEAVQAYFAWKTEYEYWSNMPTWQQAVISPPTAPTYMQEDSSTGIGQMFAWVAINAHNLTIDKGLITGTYYNANDWHDCEYIWNKLHNDDAFAIKMTTLEMYHCADYAGGGVCGSLFHCTEFQIKAILSRYNGTGTDAHDYGNECYKYYKIFKKYS